MASDQPVAANYRYWREHGGEWVAEYDRRKKQGPKYHIVELMLCDYFLHHAPARVLEYGCGTGRHLRYLSRIPGLDVHGYDQSATMVAGCLSWAEPGWLARHVRVGPPVGRLPYGDGAFDMVFTASVLVHVRPEDVAEVVRELVRVCRGHILHMESRFDPGAPAYRPDHDGCWLHDIPRVYADLGLDCRDITAGLAVPCACRVVVGSEPRFTWLPVMLGLLERMRRDLTPR